MAAEYDALGGELKVGSTIVFTYNFAIPGGSRPHTAFGTVNRLTEKMAFVNVIKMRCFDEKAGTEVRVSKTNLFVVDSNLMDRLLAAKLSI